MKPQMFIGSSVEGLPIARALQSELTYDCDSTIWNQGVFGVGDTTLQSLLKQAGKADFATFVLSGDDLTKMRGKKFSTARDNVLLELGLFAGTLGARRIFFVIPDDPSFHLPSDLHGITPAKFTPGSHEGNLTAALGPAANLIRQAIRHLTTPAAGHTNLNGEWTGEWHCKRPSYPPVNKFTATITHIGDSVKSTLATNNEHYAFEGRIHRGNYITGMWGQPDSGAAYFGPFQLVISPNGNTLSGRWSGFTSSNTVESDLFVWNRKKG